MEFADPAKPYSVRFVLLRHTLPEGGNRQSHWDLMFDSGDFLLTFALPSLPETNSPTVVAGLSNASPPLQSLAVTRLPDHRLLYLEYEGPIAPAVDTGDAARGSVRQVAAGQALSTIDAEVGQMRCRLKSPQLCAEFRYTPCGIGEETQFEIYRWQWVTS
mgnify:CR=1 FL=1